MLGLDRPPYYAKADLVGPEPSDASTPGQLQPLYTVACYCCRAWTYLDAARTKRQAARLAKDKGWGQEESGLWTCPECLDHGD